MERNNQCTRPTTVKTPVELTSQMFPTASSSTFKNGLTSVKMLDEEVKVYTAELAAKGIDPDVMIKAIERIKADAELAETQKKEAEARENNWMTVGSGTIWQPVYAYCVAVTKSAYTNPIKAMMIAIMGALKASSDKVHTSTVLSLKLTQAYSDSSEGDEFLRQLKSIEQYMKTILETAKYSNENGFDQLEDIHYGINTWIETVKPE